MSNYKRRKPRGQVRCTICTDDRRNIGGERRQREQEARAFEESADSEPRRNSYH